MANNFVEGVDVDKFFFSFVRKRGHCHKLTLRLQSAGSPHQCSAAVEGQMA